MLKTLRPVKHMVKKTSSLLGFEVHKFNYGYEIFRCPKVNGVRVNSAFQYNTSDKIGKFYENRKCWTTYLDTWGYDYYDMMLRLMQEKGIDCNGKNVADIGCGTGHLLLIMKENFSPASMMGVDIDDSALEIAKTTIPEADVFYGDLLNMPETGKKYDVVFCTEVLEHIPQADSALENLLSLINTPGIAIVSVPNGRVDTFEGHIHFWSPESWSLFIRNICQGQYIETGLWRHREQNYAIITFD